MIICHIHITLFHTNPLPSHEIIGIGDGFFIRIGGKVKQLVGYLEDWKKKSVCNLIFKLIISGFVKRMKQKDLALKLGRSEAEISKWMRGTHNFTIDTLVSTEDALEAPIVQVCHSHTYSDYEFEPMLAAEE